ncbi:hypothetical protein V9L05_03880 [Bernardetia sp. Wsw4-3y2]|uniref:hypothetical protein n=1 Tax=Bernardetia sp. Wsw4-3y2 TaxID=3127471 RepID=UPI0030CD5717
MTIEEYIDQNLELLEKLCGKKDTWKGENYDKIMMNVKVNYDIVVNNMKSAEYLTPIESSFESHIRPFWKKELGVEKPKEDEVVIMEFAWHGETGQYLKIGRDGFIYNAVNNEGEKINLNSYANPSPIKSDETQLLVDKVFNAVKDARECPKVYYLDGTEYIFAAYIDGVIKLGKVYCPRIESNMGKLLKEVQEVLRIKGLLDI